MDADLIREQIKLYIKEHGITSVWVSKQIDVSESMFSHFKNGKVALTTDKLQLLIELLNSDRDKGIITWVKN
jgi:predicted XRE-type DNA-binding protein